MLRVVLYLLVLELTTDQSLKRKNGILGVHDGLALGGETDEALSVFCDGDNRGGCPCTLGILDHTRRLTLYDGDT